MDYPFLRYIEFNGGLLVACIAVVHVLIAHYAVGGGLVLPLGEYLARRTGNASLLRMVHSHARFYIPITLVLGAVTGVGLWFVISLTAPAALGLLVHRYVYIWIAEWAAFLVEILAAMAFLYGFHRLSFKHRQVIGAIYGTAAVLSLVLINAVLAAMLDPELADKSGTLAAFASPVYLPTLVLRMALCLNLASTVSLHWAARIPEPGPREAAVRGHCLAAAAGLLVAMAAGYWLKLQLPETASLLAPKVTRADTYMNAFAAGGLGVGALALVAFMRNMAWPRTAAIGLALLAGLGCLGAFEGAREAMRKPWLLPGVIYANGTVPGQQERLAAAQGGPTQSNWLKAGPDDDPKEYGRELFLTQCAACHSLGGPMNDLEPRLGPMTPQGVDALLSGLHLRGNSMPPFVGTREDRAALAAFLGSEAPDAPGGGNTTPEVLDPPQFDPGSATHVLTVAGAGNMPTSTGPGCLIQLSGTPRIVRAQLFERDISPSLVTEGVDISFTVGARKDVFYFNEESGMYETIIPVRGPRTMDVWAQNEEGERLAATTVALPGPELGCASCHGGRNNSHGPNDDTSLAILELHDRRHGTALEKEGLSGKRVRCGSCHPRQPGGAAPDSPMALSPAIHGMHTLYMADQGGKACVSCHGGSGVEENGYHAHRGMDCTRCHGTLAQHSGSLLGPQAKAGSARAEAYLREISQLEGGEAALKAVPRKPWEEQPSCQGCHTDEYTRPYPNTSQGYGHWNDSPFSTTKGEMDSVACVSCHGPAHGIYPAAYGVGAADAQPMQYQHTPKALGARTNCGVCHVEDLDMDVHHQNTIQKDACPLDYGVRTAP